MIGPTIFSILLHHHISKVARYFRSTFRSVVSAPQRPICSTSQVSYSNFKSYLLVKRVSFLLHAACAMTIPDLISLVLVWPYVIMLPKLLKYSTFSGCFWSIVTCIGDHRYHKWCKNASQNTTIIVVFWLAFLHNLRHLWLHTQRGWTT
jgi:hypothetical protein